MQRPFGRSTKLRAGLAGLVGVAALSYWAGGGQDTATEEPAGTFTAIDQGVHEANLKASRNETLPVKPGPLTPFAASSRYQLHGVIAGSEADSTGIALIATDGSAARAFRVGATVDGEFVLLGVSPGGAILGLPSGPPLVVLDVLIGAGAALAPPGRGSESEDAGVAPPVATAGDPMQSVALAANGTQPPVSTESDVMPLLAPDLLPDTLPTARAPVARPSPGRRLRLRPMNSGP